MAISSESDGITGGSVISIKCHRFSMTTLSMASVGARNSLLLQSLIWFIAIQQVSVSSCGHFGSKEQFTNSGLSFWSVYCVHTCCLVCCSRTPVSI